MSMHAKNVEFELLNIGNPFVAPSGNITWQPIDGVKTTDIEFMVNSNSRMCYEVGCGEESLSFSDDKGIAHLLRIIRTVDGATHYEKNGLFDGLANEQCESVLTQIMEQIGLERGSIDSIMRVYG